ncbi:MAG: permease prefix domain 1-containing protein [Cytophagaceae bacterium]|nr:permease prefix domain 1-containing protein [Cytophagaceae bacterium]
MERQPRFDLTAATETWLDILRQQGTFTDDDRRELHGHLLDAIEALKAKDLSEEEAFLLARHRLGSAETLGAEFGKIQRPFVVQREPVILLLGALVFLILKNGMQTVSDFAAVWFAHTWGDSLTTSLLDVGLCFVLLAGLILVVVRFMQSGKKAQYWFFKNLHRAPVLVALVVSILLGLSALGAYSAGHAFDELLHPTSLHWTHQEIWHVHNLFWLGFYLSWLLIFLNVVVQYASVGNQTLISWLQQAPAGWLVVAGLCSFTCWLGLSVAGMRLLVPTEGINRFFISAALSCLASGLVLGRSSRYSLPIRFLLILAPIAAWYGLALGENLLYDEVPSFLLSDFFALKFMASAALGALVGLGLGAFRRQKSFTA